LYYARRTEPNNQFVGAIQQYFIRDIALTGLQSWGAGSLRYLPLSLGDRRWLGRMCRAIFRVVKKIGLYSL
jgi:hypothetical protein